jgi:hypothetical protein
VIEKFRKYAFGEPCVTFEAKTPQTPPDILARIPELKGKRLGCWCKPDACHGDVLIELVEGRRIGGDRTVGISRIPQKSKKGRQCWE